MICGIKKRSFYIYLIALVLAIIFVVTSACLNHLAGSLCAFLSAMFLNLGCGIVPTVFVAYFVERANERELNEQRAAFRNTLLCGLPFGVLFIAKTTIKKFPPRQEERLNLYNAFKLAVKKMEEQQIPDWDHDPNEYIEKRKDYVQAINYGVNIFMRDAENILMSKNELLLSKAFTIDEINTLGNGLDDLSQAVQAATLNEMAGLIKFFVEELCKAIPEINKSFQRQIVFGRNGTIRNWTEFSADQ